VRILEIEEWVLLQKIIRRRLNEIVVYLAMNLSNMTS